MIVQLTDKTQPEGILVVQLVDLCAVVLRHVEENMHQQVFHNVLQPDALMAVYSHSAI